MQFINNYTKTININNLITFFIEKQYKSLKNILILLKKNKNKHGFKLIFEI